MKRGRIIALMMIFVGIMSSCADYLDIIPEGVPSMDNAFSNRTNAEKFLYTCYSYLPSYDNPSAAPGFLAGDEFWLYSIEAGSRVDLSGWRISRGEQNTSSPYLDYWDERTDKSKDRIWIGIRDCNIFLENIHKPQDLGDMERTRWIAEVKFLKAFYHYWMLQVYGPIPIVDTNIEVNAGVDNVRVYREPVDDVVQYISGLLDECIPDLPDYIENEQTELGRITKSIAYAVKAKMLVMVASDLFNGNTDYANYKDNKGKNLFPTSRDPQKWEAAAAACREAINYATTEGGHQLFEFPNVIPSLSEYSKIKLSISEAVCDLWNKEIIWGASTNSNALQNLSFPKLSAQLNNYVARSLLAPTMKVAETFYSDNGVPIEEDKGTYWATEYDQRYETTATPNEEPNQYNIEANARVAKLHLHREPRFYANLAFNRSKWYVKGNPDDNASVNKIHNYRMEYSGLITNEDYSITGYYARKLCSYQTEITNTTFSPYRYAFPIIRLADLYLLYAEALNEVFTDPSQKDADGKDLYFYIDAVRERAGLKGVKESWNLYSKYPTKPATKDGMRDIIRHERACELALEGQIFWDIRRWKLPLERAVYGWNVQGHNEETYYVKTLLYDRGVYGYKQYFWPIKTSSLQRNPNLLQSPGWY